jgi:hypothetical protein
MFLAAEDQQLCNAVGRREKQFVELLERLRVAETEAAIKGTVDHFLTRKGRVEMLTELLQQMKAS